MNVVSISESIYKHLANTTEKWCGSDNQQRWLGNQTNPLINQWTEESVSYTFNSEGFRSDPFDDSGEGVAFFGCSHTMGMGIPYDQTWAYTVARTMGWKCWNLGQGGGSNDTVFRLVYHWVPILKPKFVVVLFTYPERLEILRRDEIYILSPERAAQALEHQTRFQRKILSKDYYTHQTFYEDWLLNPANSRLDEIKNRYAVEHFLKENSAGSFLTDVFNYGKQTMFDLAVRESREQQSHARDLAHPGPIANRIIADNILNSIPKEYWRQ